MLYETGPPQRFQKINERCIYNLCICKEGGADRFFFPPFALIPCESWSLAGVSLKLRRMKEKDTVTFPKERQHLQMPLYKTYDFA